MENPKILRSIYGAVLLVLTVLFSISISSISNIAPGIIAGVALLISFALLEGFRALIAAQLNIESESKKDLPVSEAKVIEARTRHRFVRAAIDTILSPIIIIDAEGRAIAVNKAAHKRFSRVKLNEKIDFFIRDPKLLAAIDRSQMQSIPVQINLEHYFPDPKFDKVEISTFEIDGRRRTIIMFVDETDLRRAEQLRVDFLANAGHELRTPLASIRGFLETLTDGAKTDKKALERFLPIMSREAERMNRLINDILSLSKIEMNEHVAPKEIINATEALEYALAAIESANCENEIVYDSAKCACNVCGDSDELQQVFINLIENAIKYGQPKSKVKIEAHCNIDYANIGQFANRKWENSSGLALLMPTDVNRKYTIFRIENCGKGIKAKYMTRLSERFYRIDDESAHIRGTGLGLAIVKHIIRRHLGGFYVESDEKSLTAFSFAIPVE